MSTANIPDLKDFRNNKEIKIYKGDQKVLIFTLRNNDGSAKDISGNTASDYKLKGATNLTTAPTFTLSGSFTTDGSDGKIQFTLTATETAAEVTDGILELLDQNGGVQEVLAQFTYNVLDTIGV